MDEEGLAELLELQDGVIARRQALELKCSPNDIRRLLRQREWVRAFPGVYVNHTGPLTWQQRAWAAVQLAWPAALCHSTAIRAADGPGRLTFDDSAPLHVAVDRGRFFVADPSQIIAHHLSGLDDKVNWNLRPPRVRIEHAVLDVAAEAHDDFAAIEVLASAVQSRRTTAPRIKAVLDGRARLARREFLSSVLADIAEGTCSVLEHGYVARVERPHGLPRAARQVAASARGLVYRDVTYVAQSLVVELDGRHFHDNATARDKDMDRDLDAAVDGLSTVRVGWGQVFRRPCLTAERIGLLLQRNGWTSAPSACPHCDAQQRLARVSPDDTNPRRSSA
jgi:hypothetical protein